VFKTATRRTAAPKAGAPIPVSTVSPSAADREEIEFRFAALKPFLTI